MSANHHRGPWADTASSAMHAALDEVGVSAGEYVECTYGDGVKLEPVDPDRELAIDVELFYSERRDQWKAILRRVPAAERVE